jgi:threonine dehydratase
VLKDRPGALERLVEVLTEYDANIYAIEHDRTSRDITMNDAEVELDLETRGHDHVAAIIEGLEDAGYEVEILV